MPPKGKDKAGAKAKQGTQLKDILPAGSKPPREGEVFEQVEEITEAEAQKRDIQYEYLPYRDYPKWPGADAIKELFEKEKVEFEEKIKQAAANAAAKQTDDIEGSENEEAKDVPEECLYTDDFKFILPPSYGEFSRKKISWHRPAEAIYEIIREKELRESNKVERKSGSKRRKTSKRLRLDSSGSVRDAKRAPGRKASKNKIKRPPVNFKVIGYQERQETEEETKKRKDEEEKVAGKDKKKPPKKGEEEEPPQMVRVAIESNMDMGFLMPAYSKWVTSQLQFIKDRAVRDTVTKEPIWKRIYPQESGIPIKSLSGKYRVKLKYLGEERLVEIDDRLPGLNLFPRTTDFSEIWPQLLLKAFLKLYSFKWYPGAHYDRETGDTSIVYALTGLIGERIKVDDFHKDGLELLRKHLSDNYYFNNKTYVMTYCGPTFKPKLPSQQKSGSQGGGFGSKVGTPNQSFTNPSFLVGNMANTQKQKLALRLREIASLALSITSGKKLNLSLLNKQRPTYVIPGFGYALMDMFENNNVDMETIIRKPAVDDCRSPFASPSRAERRGRSKAVGLSPGGLVKGDSTMRKKKKKTKGLSLNKKHQTVNPSLLKKDPPIQYKLIKIKTSVGNYPILNINPPFTNTEIKLAKKWILNNWTGPQDEDAHASPKPFTKPAKDFKLEISPVKEEYDKNDPNQSKEEGEGGKKDIVYEPRTRASGGIWLQAGDFPFWFQYFIIYHNDEKISNKVVHKDLWIDPRMTYKANEQDIYIRITDPSEEELKAQLDAKAIENPDIDEKYQHIKRKIKDNRKSVLIGFSPNPTKEMADNLPRYYLRIAEEEGASAIALADKNKDNNITLGSLDFDQPKDYLFSQYFGGQMLKFQNKSKLILKPNIYAPLGYCLWVASESRIEIINHSRFWIEEQGLFSKKYQVELSNIKKEKYAFLFKFDFNPTEADTECIFKLSTEDKYLYKFLRLKIIDKAGLEHDPEDNGKQMSLSQTLSEFSSITTLNSCRTEKITFQPNQKGYSLICETYAPYDIFSLNLDLEMITNKETLELEKVEQVDPLFYSDVYTPYKYGIIFKEKIFVGQSTSAAFNITLTKKSLVKKPKAKANDDNLDSQEQEFEEVEEVAELKKNFKVEIFDNARLLATYNGNGHLTISHFKFRSNAGLEERPKEENHEGDKDAPPADKPDEKEYKHRYVIQATFDKNDWPECTIKDHEQNKDVKWEARIFSSDTVAIVKDTDKEDKENALKESWEAAEPGRAEKSHKSRIRYLALLKKQNGEDLTEEETEVLKEKRVRGSANLKEAIPDPKAAKGKVDKKAAVVEEDVKEEIKEIIFPKSEECTNMHLKEFIHHFERNRLIHIQWEKANARLRSKEEIEERQSDRENEIDLWDRIFNNRLQNRELELQDRQEKQKKTQDILLKSRKDFIEKTQELFVNRNKYRELISNRKYKEILLTDILNSEKIEITALELALKEAKDALVKKETLDKGGKKLEVLKYSKGIEEELQAASSEKNAEKMRELIEKIETEKLIIEPKILNDCKNALSKMK